MCVCVCVRACVCLCCVLEGGEGIGACVSAWVYARGCESTCIRMLPSALRLASLVFGLWSLRLQHVRDRGKGER